MATPSGSEDDTSARQREYLSTAMEREASNHESDQAGAISSLSQEAREELRDIHTESMMAEESAANTAPIRKSATGDLKADSGSLASAKRVRTAPGGQRIRMGLSTRASTLGLGRRQTTTGDNVAQRRREPFEYKFGDAVSSDSELSSSSDEEQEATAGPESHPNAAGQSSAPVGEQDTSKEGPRRESYSKFDIGNEWFRTKGRISKQDGRLKISINETANSGYVANALGRSIRNHLDIPTREKSRKDAAQSRKRKDEVPHEHAEMLASTPRTTIPKPRLNIVIMVIGSRGDVQPFLRIGQILQTYGHRVRIASHPVFRDFIGEAGLEFFSVGGDPAELMAFMVKNPGLLPNYQTVKDGEIGRRRAAMGEMFEGFWRACIESTDDGHPKSKAKPMDHINPFIADAIIANPPSMAHVHIAERLGIPLHMMFTFPYTPTTQFPHPLANIKARKSNVDESYVNFMSYPLVEMLTWQGLGDIVNHFREKTLGLEPVSALWAPGALYRMKVSYTYLWSPSLVPKPRDWGPEIDLSGFVFLDLAKGFEPPKDLMDFLNAGDSPVYIGFGSIVLDDPNAMTKMIFKAAELTGQRVLLSKGWGGMGAEELGKPENIFMLGNVPHDWLFPQVSAVVHHGGAGTTAIGLKCAKPTMIVPFFGDQPFWGAMTAEAKAGAHKCIPYKKLTAELLAEGITQCLTEEAQRNVQRIADSIAREGDGAENAVKSFHRSMPFAGRHNMRCSILQDRVAVWQLRKSSLRLSTLAAEILHEKGKLKWHELKLLRHYEWNDFDGPGEPLTGSVGAITDSLYGIGEGIGMVPIRIAKHIRKREEHERRKRERQKRKDERARKKAIQRSETDEMSEVNSASLKDEIHGPLSREITNRTQTSALSSDPAEPLPMEMIHDLDYGLKRAGAAILTMPNDLHVAIAQGLHNVPRLWGDATVRKPVRITGLKSGFVAARKEFAYGMYDGWTGLYKQPKGDWDDGDGMTAKFAGLGTGLGKGIGGLAFKTTNAVWAPPAFVVKGIIKNVEKRSDAAQAYKAHIRKAQIIQGQRDLHALKDRSREDDSQLLQVQERVSRGFEVFACIWATGREHFGAMGSMGKYKMRREKKHWDVNGALENVDTANEALQAWRHGGDMERLFAKRRQEMRAAEQPRAGVMDREQTLDEGEDASRDVHHEQDSIPPPQNSK